MTWLLSAFNFSLTSTVPFELSYIGYFSWPLWYRTSLALFEKYSLDAFQHFLSLSFRIVLAYAISRHGSYGMLPPKSVRSSNKSEVKAIKSSHATHCYRFSIQHPAFHRDLWTYTCHRCEQLPLGPSSLHLLSLLFSLAPSLVSLIPYSLPMCYLLSTLIISLPTYWTAGE